MLEKFFDQPYRIQEIRNRRYGSLIVDFAGELYQAGYSIISARRHIRTVEHFVHWIGSKKGIRITTLTELGVDKFLNHLNRCRCPHFARSDRRNVEKGTKMFVNHLRRTGVIAAATELQSTEDSEQFTSFCEWMRQQRGTCDKTLNKYKTTVNGLVRCLGDDPNKYNARNLREFLLKASKDCGWAATKNCTTSLRMFLRFLIAEGNCPVGLDAAIPGIAHWRLSSLPQYLQPDEVESVIRTCDPCTHRGSRDRAILLLLARLGLRAGDIVEMRLSDIEWKEASIRVSGKGRRQTRLPLTQELGDAISDYITAWRPPAATDKLFLCILAPFRPFSCHSAVSVMVSRALRRADVRCAGRNSAHIFRHSAATSMLRQGASLQDIANVLRHRSTSTTEIYAKVDILSLQEIAQPWTEVEPC
jgi:site-specific recombinase XerD